MEDFELGASGQQAGRVVFGTMTFGAQVDEREAAAMVGACRDAGVTMFDTSNNYSGGASEEILGRVIRPFRDEVLVSTKGGSHVDQADASLAGLGRRALTAAIDGSLRRLGVDRIDVYYLHRPDPTTPLAETLETMADAVRAGKVRWVGQSNFAAWQIVRLNCVAREHGWPEVLVSQPMYNLLGRRVEDEYAACSRELGLTNIVYNPLAGGLLTGKHRPGAEPAAGTRFSKETYRDRYWNPAQFDAVGRLAAIAAAAGLSLVQLAYRWVLHRDLTDAMLLGASGLDQLRSNLADLDGPALDDATAAACDDVWRDLHGAAPLYNR